jgi:uncharacterized protein (TIGR03435 family)
MAHVYPRSFSMTAPLPRRRRSIVVSIAAAVLIFPFVPIAAQTSVVQQPKDPAPPAPAFDVAAIHPHISEPHEHNSIWSSPSDGQFNAANISALALINWAYEIPETRILGAPDWVNSAHFNIEAKADPAVDQQLHGLTSEAGRKLKEKMVQSLLADRFKLVAHAETRELPVYDLVVAKGGPKLGATQSDGTTINTGYGRIEVQSSNSVAVFAEELSKVAGRDVVDKTGVAGRYDLKLRFTPDQGPAMLNGQPIPEPPPDLFTALQEQLGLKLEPAKGPVQVLVIDQIELPSAN